MPALKIEQIGGMLPAWDPHLLPAGQAANAVNLYPFSGRVEGWRTPKVLRQLLNSAAKFAFRLPQTTQASATAYLIFTGNPVANDTVTIGQFTYKFVAALSKPYDVLLGANSTISARNLNAAITTDNGTQVNENKLYGPDTAGNSILNLLTTNTSFAPLGPGSGSAAYIPYIAAIGSVVGASLNGTPVSETSVNLQWNSDLTSLAHTTASLTGGQNPTFNNSMTSPSTWLEFLDPDTNVVRSQVLNDQFDRYYFASPSQQPQYNTAARIVAGQAPFLLGLNPPLVAPVVATGGGGNAVVLGDNTALGSTFSFVANTVYLVPVIPTQDMVLNDILWMPEGTDANVNFAGLLYSDSGTQSAPAVSPANLLGTGSVTTGITSGTGAVSQFVTPIPLSANTPYWIGIMIDTNELVEKGGKGGSATVSFPNTFIDGPPGFAPNVTTGLANLEMYGEAETDDVIEARSYVYTYATAYQEESAPSPFTLANGWTDGTWTLNLFQPPAADMGIQRNIAFFNIYRTITGTSGTTEFFFVAQIPITQTTYADSATDNVIALNIILPSTNYFPPPPDLQGLINMPNGLVAGFIGKQVWICQAFLPHAWPPANVFTTDFPIVGMGFTAGALVACTEANSYILSGTTVPTMSIVKCQPSDPCLSRGSILSTDLGVYYQSPNGLIQVTNLAQSTNTSELWIKRENWVQLTPQTGLRVVPMCGTYFGYQSGLPSGAAVTPPVPNGFFVELQQDNTSFTIWPQPGGHRVGFSPLAPPNGFNVDNIFTDPWSGVTCLIQNGAIYYFDFTDPAPLMMPCSYTSKIYQQTNKKNFSAMRLYFTTPLGTPPQSAAPVEIGADAPAWQTLQPGQYAVVLVYASCGPDGQMKLVTAREVRKSGGLMRILGDFKAEEWQFTILSCVPVSNLQVATTIKELGNV